MNTQQTTDYNGMNLPQLLDLMHDPVLPEAVSWWPQTQGWVIACLWLIAIVGIIVWQRVTSFHRNRYRREALASLDRLASRVDENNQGLAGEITTLLKRTALAAYPRSEVAALYGSAWAEFLIRSCGADPVIEGSAKALAAAAYRPDIDARALVVPARRWIKVHRA